MQGVNSLFAQARALQSSSCWWCFVPEARGRRRTEFLQSVFPSLRSPSARPMSRSFLLQPAQLTTVRTCKCCSSVSQAFLLVGSDASGEFGGNRRPSAAQCPGSLLCLGRSRGPLRKPSGQISCAWQANPAESGCHEGQVDSGACV